MRLHEYQKTNIDHIYAVGDCAMVKNRITGKGQWSAMGSTANITGRCLAKTLTGTSSAYNGCLGTGVVKLSGSLSAGRTGLTEEQAVNAGFDAATVICVTDDKTHYYPDASSFITKLIADKAGGKLLGLQVIGKGAVDKMTDIAVVGISAGLKVSEVEMNCPIKAAKLVDGKLVISSDCNNCGRCKGKCPFGAIPEYTNGYKIYIGGRWGKKYANGRPLDRLFTSEEEVLDIVEKAILFFRNEGITGERFADTIARLGFEYVEDKLLNTEINKSAVLNKTVKGGATC